MTTHERGQHSRLTKALLETADDMRCAGVMDAETHRKITMRHLADSSLVLNPPMAPGEIKALRKRAHLSQAVLARYLNLTTGYVSQLERGAKKPTGPALALLNIIRRKGIEAIL